MAKHSRIMLVVRCVSLLVLCQCDPEAEVPEREWSEPVDWLNAQQYEWNDYDPDSDGANEFGTLYLDNYDRTPIRELPGLHPGVDIGGQEGDDVLAITSGNVYMVDKVGGTDWGKYVVLEHFDVPVYDVSLPSSEWTKTTFYSLYAHLSMVLVSRGRSVAAGEHIGELGHTGYCIGDPPDHLHLQIDHQIDVDGTPYWPTKLGANGAEVLFGRDGWVSADSASQQSGVIDSTWDPMLTIRHESAFKGVVRFEEESQAPAPGGDAGLSGSQVFDAPGGYRWSPADAGLVSLTATITVVAGGGGGGGGGSGASETLWTGENICYKGKSGDGGEAGEVMVVDIDLTGSDVLSIVVGSGGDGGNGGGKHYAGKSGDAGEASIVQKNGEGVVYANPGSGGKGGMNQGGYTNRGEGGVNESGYGDGGMGGAGKNCHNSGNEGESGLPGYVKVEWTGAMASTEPVE